VILILDETVVEWIFVIVIDLDENRSAVISDIMSEELAARV
jgi:hypothetical protein